MIGIIDYDAGNIKSVEKALAYLGEETVVSRDPQVLLRADKVILPGVGSFGEAMENLHNYGLVPVIQVQLLYSMQGMQREIFSNAYASLLL